MTMLKQDVKNYVSGDTLPINVTAKDETGAILDLTGAALVYEVSTGEEPTQPPMLTKTIGSGITVVSAAAGTFTITLTAGETASMVTGNYFHECEVTISGAVYTLFQGVIMALDDQVVP
jgi:hypothetical protein